MKTKYLEYNSEDATVLDDNTQISSIIYTEKKSFVTTEDLSYYLFNSLNHSFLISISCKTSNNEFYIIAISSAFSLTGKVEVLHSNAYTLQGLTVNVEMHGTGVYLTLSEEFQNLNVNVKALKLT